VDCKARVYDKIVDYVDRLESIPVEEGSRREADSRYHRLDPLNDAVTTEYFQRDLMSGMTPRSNRRFNFAVKKWAKTGTEMGLSMEDLEDAKERHEVIDLDQD